MGLDVPYGSVDDSEFNFHDIRRKIKNTKTETVLRVIFSSLS